MGRTDLKPGITALRTRAHRAPMALCPSRYGVVRVLASLLFGVLVAAGCGGVSARTRQSRREISEARIVDPAVTADNELSFVVEVRVIARCEEIAAVSDNPHEGGGRVLSSKYCGRGTPASGVGVFIGQGEAMRPLGDAVSSRTDDSGRLSVLLSAEALKAMGESPSFWWEDHTQGSRRALAIPPALVVLARQVVEASNRPNDSEVDSSAPQPDPVDHADSVPTALAVEPDAGVERQETVTSGAAASSSDDERVRAVAARITAEYRQEREQARAAGRLSLRDPDERDRGPDERDEDRHADVPQMASVSGLRFGATEDEARDWCRYSVRGTWSKQPRGLFICQKPVGINIENFAVSWGSALVRLSKGGVSAVAALTKTQTGWATDFVDGVTSVRTMKFGQDFKKRMGRDSDGALIIKWSAAGSDTVPTVVISAAPDDDGTTLLSIEYADERLAVRRRGAR